MTFNIQKYLIEVPRNTLMINALMSDVLGRQYLMSSYTFKFIFIASLFCIFVEKKAVVKMMLLMEKIVHLLRQNILLHSTYQLLTDQQATAREHYL